MSDTTDTDNHLREMPTQVQALLTHMLTKDLAVLNVWRTGLSVDGEDDEPGLVFRALDWRIEARLRDHRAPVIAVRATPHEDSGTVDIKLTYDRESISLAQLHHLIDAAPPAEDYGNPDVNDTVDTSILEPATRRLLAVDARPVTALAAWLTVAATKHWNIKMDKRIISGETLLDLQLMASVAHGTMTAYGVILHDGNQSSGDDHRQHTYLDLTMDNDDDIYRTKYATLDEIIAMTRKAAPGSRPIALFDADTETWT